MNRIYNRTVYWRTNVVYIKKHALFLCNKYIFAFNFQSHCLVECANGDCRPNSDSCEAKSNDILRHSWKELACAQLRSLGTRLGLACARPSPLPVFSSRSRGGPATQARKLQRFVAKCCENEMRKLEVRKVCEFCISLRAKTLFIFA